MELEFVPLDYSYFDYENTNLIKIYGRSSKGKKICLIDNYEPNFWVVLKKNVSKEEVDKLIKKIGSIEISKGSRTSKVEKVEIHEKNYLGKNVKAIKIFATNHKDLHDIASEIGNSEIIEARREYDINILTKYISSRKLEPLNWYKIKGEIIDENDFGGMSSNLDVDLCLKLKSFSLSSEKPFEPKVLAYDIETDDVLGKGRILMISLHGENYKKVLTWNNVPKSQGYVENFKDEAEMLEAFSKEIRNFAPDILCGYFSDGFDLPYLKKRASENKIKLNLGVDDSEPSFSKGRINSGKIEGIVHLDLYRFISAVFYQYLKSESMKLDDVAEELIGEKKEEFNFADIGHLDDKGWKKFYSYNLRDSEVTYKLFQKLWPDFVEFSRIVREPLFKVCRDGMSSHVENYLLHQLERFNEIAEKKPTNEEISHRRSLGKYEGAFVYEPKPGLYENIVMFDFTSMYPTVIISYNLGGNTYKGKDKKGNYIFDKKKGFFPTLLEEIIQKRKKYKSEYSKNKNNLTKARSNAYKLLANASYGYLGFFGARYYSRESAAATAKFAKENILKAIENIKDGGYEILYSDTDSIAFLVGKSSKKEISEFLEKLNSKLPGIMELDLEDFYKRGIFVSKRSGESGAKKKYALLTEENELKIRGFETVRRDWCPMTRKLQSEILRLILIEGNEENALKLLKETISDLQKGEVKIEDLMIKTQLKKSIGSYVSKGPHVIAAEKMKDKKIPINEGMVIEYYIGKIKGKSKKIGDRVFLLGDKEDYDPEYYLNNQILPVVEGIFNVFNINVKELFSDPKQKSLGEF